MAKDNKAIVIGASTMADSLVKELLAGCDYPVKLKITNLSAHALIVAGFCNLAPCYDANNSTVIELKQDKDLRFFPTIQGIANVRNEKYFLSVELIQVDAVEKSTAKGGKSG
jgi:hypothetical protein